VVTPSLPRSPAVIIFRPSRGSRAGRQRTSRNAQRRGGPASSCWAAEATVRVPWSVNQLLLAPDPAKAFRPAEKAARVAPRLRSRRLRAAHADVRRATPNASAPPRAGDAAAAATALAATALALIQHADQLARMLEAVSAVAVPAVDAGWPNSRSPDPSRQGSRRSGGHARSSRRPLELRAPLTRRGPADHPRAPPRSEARPAVGLPGRRPQAGFSFDRQWRGVSGKPRAARPAKEAAGTTGVRWKAAFRKPNAPPSLSCRRKAALSALRGTGSRSRPRKAARDGVRARGTKAR